MPLNLEYLYIFFCVVTAVFGHVWWDNLNTHFSQFPSFFWLFVAEDKIYQFLSAEDVTRSLSILRWVSWSILPNLETSHTIGLPERGILGSLRKRAQIKTDGFNSCRNVVCNFTEGLSLVVCVFRKKQKRKNQMRIMQEGRVSYNFLLITLLD
ncbi:hypothetical protein DCAR_0832637 [Daucus carota subsp. sativus]|uniref:Uncharacterized protein n=1 Tax=Daucus carota subsp. sativus TaxID=79200 RepID=A0AAF0XRV2_DAUCS|nr:PREDICTED: uncharacterized protein LOC108197758 [Daucus carota subsp. sativus]WOH13128.1 hypothetical protein DCAR_0832637 [Daucus carota subsp. sativus]